VDEDPRHILPDASDEGQTQHAATGELDEVATLVAQTALAEHAHRGPQEDAAQQGERPGVVGEVGPDQLVN